MIIISLPASWLTPAISIEDMSEVVVSSWTMTELWASIEAGSYNYGHSYTWTAGDQYKISIDAGATITDPLIRYNEIYFTEEGSSSGWATLAEIEASTILAKKSHVDGVPAAVRSNLAVELARLDAAVTTRMATFTYTAPDNSSIWAIKTKTDQLLFTSGNLHAVAKLVEDKTGYSLTPAERTAIAVAVEQAILNDGDGQAILNAIVWAIGNQNIDEIALVAAIRADIERNGWMLDIVPTLAQIEASSVLAKESSVTAIPTNPLLANDVRLDNLDAPVSWAWWSWLTLWEIEWSAILAKEATVLTRATPNDVQVTVDGGFSSTDRTTLETIPTLSEIEASSKFTNIEWKLALLERMERATIRIDGTQLVMEDWTWEIQRWNMKDANGLPTSSVPYKKEKIS